LLGPNEIPAGLFRDPAVSHLSGILFSNAATLGKFNRMGFLAGWRPPGLSMTRTGILVDRTPGAVDPTDFSLDVLSSEYQEMWPRGEEWCQELEIFHNPFPPKSGVRALAFPGGFAGSFSGLSEREAGC